MIGPAGNQRGAALLLALIFMLILTMLVAVLHRTTLMDILFSSYYQESQKAFFAAESGIKAGLGWLADQQSPPENQLNPAPFFSNTTTSMPRPSTVWSGYQTVDGGKYRYYIQHLKDAPASYAGGESAKVGTSTSSGAKVHFYRITAEGESTTGTAWKQIQVVTTVGF